MNIKKFFGLLKIYADITEPILTNRGAIQYVGDEVSDMAC
jgi:hypothetical protein